LVGTFLDDTRKQATAAVLHWLASQYSEHTVMLFFFASFHHSVRSSAVFKKENGFFVFYVSSHHDYIFCLLHDGKRLKITTPAGSSEFHKSLESFLYSLAP